MATYTAPLRDMKFVYHELFNGDELQKLLRATAILPSGCSGRGPRRRSRQARGGSAVSLEPLRQTKKAATSKPAWCVRPKGFKEAYQQFIAGGWTGIAADPRLRRTGLSEGGQHAGRGNDLLVQRGVRHVSGPHPLRYNALKSLRHGRTEADVSAEVLSTVLGAAPCA